MNESLVAVSNTQEQATSRAPVLMPALVEGAFDYLVPVGTMEGALVEAKLAGRALVGVVWEIVAGIAANAVTPSPLTGEGWDEGALKVGAQLDSPLTPRFARPSPARGEGSPAAPLAAQIPLSKLKPITRVIDTLPPLKKEFRQWLDWVSDFTLAPKGAVLSLCGLAHAAKMPKKGLATQEFNVNLPMLTVDQQAAANELCTNFSATEARSAEALPLRGRERVGAEYGTISPHITIPLRQTRDSARKLRSEMTDAESELWYHLQKRAMGVKFRKQHPIGNYITDFACLELNLIIELDGGQHNETAALQKDAARTTFLEAQGYRVMRFWNNDVLQNTEAVLERIAGEIASLQSPHPSPPPQGEGLCASRSPAPFTSKPILLDGVTGSGKTEVYFHAIASAIAAGRQVLVLLPEIALTHQWLERFEKTFGATPVMWHSRMTPVAKARAWQAVARGGVQVVVGARSSLFLPFAALGLIIVDEEHDPSYKQEDGVLYHARDMAVVRARFEQVPIVLVSATPSLETLENVREGKYRAVHLTSRFGSAGLPAVKLIDMRLDQPERGDFLSPSAKRALLDTLARGEQVLFFLNRRGYAPLLLCRGCGHRFQCTDCSAWLVVHGKKVVSRQSSVVSEERAHDSRLTTHSSLHCHHCGHKEKMPAECPECKAPQEKLAPCGPGVERIAEEVRAMFVGGEGLGFVKNGAAGDVPSPSGGRLGWGLDEANSFFLEAQRKGHPLEKTLDHARTLRKHMTEAEKRLWQILRGETLPIKFRKQHPIGNYVVDFASFAPKLVIELDGGQHNTPEAAAYDRARTEFLTAQGFTVVRFWNNEVMENIEGVVARILEVVAQISPHPDLPPEGEGTPPPMPDSSFPTLAVLSSDESITPETWAQIEAGSIDILVGTQMVAKGHHFPRLTLVVVVDADVGLDGADLRAGERTYQMLHQLGGRAGRGELAGTVLVQTYMPDHPVMKALVAHDRDRLMALEAKERRAGGWPPFGQLAAILLDGKEEAAVKTAGQMLARTAPEDTRLRVLGPAPAPLSKLRGQYRYRLLVKAQPGIHLQRTLRAWLAGQRFKGVRIKIDVNPYYFM